MFKKSTQLILAFFFITTLKSYSQNSQEIKYVSSTYTFINGDNIQKIEPKGANGFKVFSIDEDLPDGLNFDKQTGIITGTAKGVLNKKYVITAKGDSGKTSTSIFTINILPKNDDTFKSPLNATLVWWGTIGLVIIFTLVIVVYVRINNNNKEKICHEALGLPNGSIRAIIALILVFFLIIIYVTLIFNYNDKDLGKQLAIQLFNIGSTVIAFYFGSKTSESSQKNLLEAINKNTLNEALKDKDKTESPTEGKTKA